MKEGKNILKILQETEKAIKSENIIALKHLSDRTIHTASISQDPDNIAIAVIVYSLSKMIQRKRYHEYKGWDKFYRKFITCIGRSKNAVKRGDEKEFKKCLAEIRGAINNLSGDLRKNIQDVFRKASINKASRIYEHGISMEQTAKLLGITMWELANYAGHRVGEAKLTKTQNVRDRIKLAMSMFR